MKKLLSILMVAVLSAALLCTALVVSNEKTFAEDVIVYQEDFSGFADGAPYSQEMENVYRATGNKLVSSAQYNCGTSPLIETGLASNWEYSMDIMYPTGNEGYLGINVLGLFASAPDAWTEFTIQKTNDRYVMFIKKDNIQVAFNNDYAKGGLEELLDNDTIGFDKVITLRIAKFDNGIYMYVNNTMALYTTFEGLGTPRQFNPYNYLTGSTTNFVGLTIDNIVLKNITTDPRFVYTETFDAMENGTVYGGGNDILKVTDGKLLTTQQFEQGSVPLTNVTIPSDFEVSMDLSFPTDANGYVGFNFVGLINGYPAESTELTFQKGTDASYIFFKNVRKASDGTQYNIYNNDPANGGMSDFNVDYNTPVTLKLVKFKNQVEVYANSTLVIKTYIKDMATITGINLYHWDAIGVSIDNITIKKAASIKEFIYEPGQVLYDNNFDTLPDGWAVGNDYDGGIVAQSGVLRAINGNQNFGRQVSWMSAYGVPTPYNFEAKFDAIFPASALGAAGYTIDVRNVDAIVGGRVDFEIQRLENNVGVVLIRDGGGNVVAISNNPAKGGKNTFTIDDNTNYTVKIVKSDYQIEIYVNDTLMLKTAMEFNKKHDDSFLYATTNSNIGIDNFKVLGVTKITDIINIGPEERVLPEGVYFAEGFNADKLNNELYGYKDAAGGRLLTSNDGWKEPYIGKFTADKYVSANIQLINALNTEQPRAGFYMEYANRIYVDARLSEDGTQIYVVISKDGDLIAINNDATKGGKLDVINTPVDGMFNLGYTVEEAGTQTTVKAYFNGKLAAEAVFDLVAGEAGVDYRFFTANTSAYVDDMLITSVAYRANTINDYYIDTTNFTNIRRTENFNGKVAGQYIENFANENYGFVFDAYGNVMSQTTKQYNASYTGPDDLTEFTFVAQMKDAGTYSDGTNHVGGITTRFQNLSRNDVQICSEANEDGTSIQVFTLDGTCQLDYKDATKGGGINPDLKILPGTEFTVSIYMQESNYMTVYINDVKVIQGFLPEASIGGFGFRSWNSYSEYDNMTIAELQSTFPDGTAVTAVPKIDVPVTGVNLSTSSVEIAAGESAVIRANTAPYNATPKAIKWYVNGVLVEGANTNEYTFTGTEAGEYLIECEMDGIKSLSKTITITAALVTDKGLPTWGIILIVLGGLVVLGGAGYAVYYFYFKKKIVNEQDKVLDEKKEQPKEEQPEQKNDQDKPEQK